MESPDLTILLPIYRGMPYLPETMESLLNQTFRNFKILALLDGSTDGSQEYLESLGDTRIRILPSPANMGLGATLQRGLLECDTPLFARMDADDKCHADRFGEQYQYLQANANVSMVGTQFYYFGHGNFSTPTPRLPLHNDQIVSGLERGRLSLIHGSIMGRTSVMLQAGGYRIKGMGEDWDMFLRFSEKGRFGNIDKPLYGYRYHSGNQSIQHLQVQQVGIAFATHCYWQRRMGLTEPSLEDFMDAWSRRPVLQRASSFLDVVAMQQYRRGLNHFSEGHTAQGSLFLAAAAALSPLRAVKRLGRRWSHK